MDGFLFTLIMILIPILIIGIPILLSLWIYKILKKNEVNLKLRILAFLPIFLVGYFVYDAFYPSTEFYKEDFKEVTGIILPKNSEFEYKTAGFPDTHGDYTSVQIIKTEMEFYNQLPIKLIENGLSENGERIGCKEMDNAKRNINGMKIEREFSKQDGDKFYYIALLSDKETILVQRSSQ